MDIDKSLRIRCTGEMEIDWKELKPFQGKLKSITKEKFNDLKESLKKHGLPFGFDIWVDNKETKWIQDGHHRLLAFKSLEDEGWFIPPIPCNRVFAENKKEAAKTLLIRNARYAQMTGESLSDFMIDKELHLEDLEFIDIPELDMSQFDLENDNSNNNGNNDSDSSYSDKIKAPIYTPKGPKPIISELYDNSKTQMLISEIENSDLIQDEKKFLILAAQRHIIFNYQNIAEYYAHSEKSTQDLMEKSALVIIDFEKAIENGFIELTDKLNNIYENQKENLDIEGD